MPKVLNMYMIGKQLSKGQVYVGRPSKWGNPFVEGRDGTRAMVVAKYHMWILKNDKLMGALHELRGKDLVCWCAPHKCHAEILLKLANGE